jgi:hypothetical protein
MTMDDLKDLNLLELSSESVWRLALAVYANRKEFGACTFQLVNELTTIAHKMYVNELESVLNERVLDQREKTLEGAEPAVFGKGRPPGGYN